MPKIKSFKYRKSMPTAIDFKEKKKKKKTVVKKKTITKNKDVFQVNKELYDLINI